VAFSWPARGESYLIGTIWLDEQPLPNYPGEPLHALLFRSRKAAEQWCKETRAKYAARPYTRAWRFRPVRVREIVEPLDSKE
jgi:hypothetical protein